MPHLLELRLENPLNTADVFSVWFEVFDRPLARHWLQRLKFLLRKNYLQEKVFCFLGFSDSPRDLPFLCRELNRHILIVNEFYTGKQGRLSYRIPEIFSPESVFRDQKVNQSLMNSIHHHFELLIGQVWSPSRFYESADRRTRISILQLNHLCHEIESLVRTLEVLDHNPEAACPAMIVSFVGAPQLELKPEDYKEFTLDRGLGKIFLKYAQLGKTHLEVFVDQDQEIHSSNISGLRYLTGEFTVDWGQRVEGTELDGFRDDLHRFLRARGFDPSDSTLGIGRYQVAQLVPDQFPGMSLPEIQRKIGRHSNIRAIAVHDQDGITLREFPYRWSDPDYEKLYDSALRKIRIPETLNWLKWAGKKPLDLCRALFGPQPITPDRI
jgi:hypothetical protein